jgi:hypothetical protein
MCGPPHLLTEVLPYHEEGPVFVSQGRVFKPMGETLGLIIYGHSSISSEEVHRPLVERLAPALAAIAFKVIVTVDIATTYAEIRRNTLPTPMHATLPLLNERSRLRVDVGQLQPDEISVAAACLLYKPE